MQIQNRTKELIDLKTNKEQCIKEYIAEIEKMQKKISDIQMEIIKIDSKIELLQQLENEISDTPKQINEQDLIKIAKNVIDSNKPMQRVNKIITALLSRGYEFDPNKISKMLLDTNKFRINKDKFWECIEDNNTSKELFK